MSEKTAFYCRVSTADQNLARQRQQTSEYATDTLGVEPSAIEVYSDKQTGTDTDRDGYRELMEAVENGEVGLRSFEIPQITPDRTTKSSKTTASYFLRVLEGKDTTSGSKPRDAYLPERRTRPAPIPARRGH